MAVTVTVVSLALGYAYPIGLKTEGEQAWLAVLCPKCLEPLESRAGETRRLMCHQVSACKYNTLMPVRRYSMGGHILHYIGAYAEHERMVEWLSYWMAVPEDQIEIEVIPPTL